LKKAIDTFVIAYKVQAIVLGVLGMLGGISMAYFTNDAEPWGTIGGILTAFGLILTIYTIFKKPTPN
jgi:uncharacterized membrane-anchored protein